MATPHKRKPPSPGLQIHIRENHYEVRSRSMSEESEFLLVSIEAGLGRDYDDPDSLEQLEFIIEPSNRVTDSQQWGAASTIISTTPRTTTTEIEPGEKGLPKQCIQRVATPKRFSPITVKDQVDYSKEEIFMSELLSRFD